MNGITAACGTIGNPIGYRLRLIYRNSIRHGFFCKEPVNDKITFWWLGYYGFITPLKDNSKECK